MNYIKKQKKPINWDAEVNWDDISTVQAIIPYIKSEWVVDMNNKNILMEWE